jgi:hypothetical protein
VVITAAIGDGFGAQGAPALHAPVTAQPNSAAEAACNPLLELDPERSRRFDRLSAITCSGAERVLAAAASTRAGTGLVVGNALGNTSRLRASLEKVKARGARGMAPAEFPHLVHSAVAGNASIYCSLTGPVTSLSDEGLCCAASISFAGELIGGHLAKSMVVGVVEALDDGAETILDPYPNPQRQPAARRDVSQWFVLESEEHARDRKQAILARIVESRLTAGPWYEYLSENPPIEPTSNTRLVLNGVDRAALDCVPSIAPWRALQWVQVALNRAQPSGNSGAALLEALRLVQSRAAARVFLISKWGARTWVLHLEAATFC